MDINQADMRSLSIGSTSIMSRSAVSSLGRNPHSRGGLQDITRKRVGNNSRDGFVKQYSINLGYLTDDEASDIEGELQDSGRTRSSSRRGNSGVSASNSTSTSDANNSSNVSATSQSNSSGGSRGRKRKTRRSGNDESDSEDPNDGNDKSRLKLDDSQAEPEKMDCSCPKDVMRCIGILPSLPIAAYFQTDDSDSSLNDDLSTFTVLPLSHRTRKCEEGEG